MAYTTINKSADYFNTKLYTGNGSTQSITGVGFQPDWLWIKERGDASSHAVMDSVRGANKKIMTNATDVESTETQYITSFDSDGFSIGQNNGINQSGIDTVAWNWKANGSGSTNYDGSITSTVSANTTAGFSIVTYTGTGANATVGHGLGVAPAFYIIKSRNNAYDWRCYHKSLGNGKYIDLTSTAAAATNSNAWNNTSPTSTVFSLSTGSTPNASGGTFVAYCFAEKTGYSKFGSYKGNGNANGSFIYTGFKPAFIILKVSSDINDWTMFDTKRPGYNVTNQALLPNLNNAESTDHNIDILSNGFKIRDNDGTVNANDHTHIYMAFGQTLVGTNNIPATAR